MLPIPAIDLKDGQCVRLKQGRMDEATVFLPDPVAAAERWAEQGAKRLHLVDLNGAFAGSPRNAAAVAAIVKRFPELEIQIGGGIRDEDCAQRYWDLGVRYCILGSLAVSQPEKVQEIAARHPQRVILGIDAREGWVATEGWAKTSNCTAVALAQKFDAEKIAAIIYTDIARDGMMQGVNLEQTQHLAAATSIPVIASGGVSSLKDLIALAQSAVPIGGAIIGRALYEGAFTLREALAATQSL